MHTPIINEMFSRVLVLFSNLLLLATAVVSSGCSSKYQMISGAGLAEIEQAHRQMLAGTWYLKTQNDYHFFRDDCLGREPDQIKFFKIKQVELNIPPDVLDRANDPSYERGVAVVFDKNSISGRWDVLPREAYSAKIKLKTKRTGQKSETMLKVYDEKIAHDTGKR